MTPRLPQLPVEVSDPSIREVFDLARSRMGRLPNMYRALGYSPSVLAAWHEFVFQLRDKPRLARRLRELAILRVAHVKSAKYPWVAHERMADSFQIRPEQLAAIPAWRESDAFSADEVAVLALTDEVLASDVTDATFEEIVRRFGQDGAVELIVTAAFYETLAKVANALRVDVDQASS